MQVSINGTSWTAIKDVWGKTAAAADSHTGLNANARYVKVYCINRATAYGFSLYELEVYGTAAGARNAREVNDVKEALTVFPNPVSAPLTLQVPKSDRPDGRVTVTDNWGRVVFARPVQATTEVTLDLSHLPAGLYLLTWLDGSRKLTQRISRK